MPTFEVHSLPFHYGPVEGTGTQETMVVARTLNIYTSVIDGWAD
jgi:hypothetical protein